MSNDPFDSPGSSVGVNWEDLNGRLLLITPLAQEKEINTDYGPKDAVRANVVVLDGDDAPEEYRDALIFPNVLQQQVRANIGTSRANLGRLGQGNQKKGQKPPWKLSDPTDADKDVARSWFAGGMTASAPETEAEEREPVTAGGGKKKPW
jgi:hypothetical protein